MCNQDSRRSYRTYTYTDLCLFRTPVGVTELILILRNISLHFRSYTELNLFGGTRRYHRDYGTYTGISEHILVLQNLYWSYGTYTCLTELIRILYWFYRVYSGVSDLILVFRSIYMYFGFYTCITELIHVFQILHVYYGT